MSKDLCPIVHLSSRRGLVSFKTPGGSYNSFHVSVQQICRNHTVGLIPPNFPAIRYMVHATTLSTCACAFCKHGSIKLQNLEICRLRDWTPAALYHTCFSCQCECMQSTEMATEQVRVSSDSIFSSLAAS